ncbi:OmpA family protein [Tunicatimonas pelagia]|uniref:OmpA family protein n=1 Tax=Tunicatimonas pelagia TaxID=931531 RepID=UPI0026660035|nr:OmpA family protein [Tunicatimonas pelagia]WKN44462.1 OmpA family protein [Tunicatimonas pelagia]
MNRLIVKYILLSAFGFLHSVAIIAQDNNKQVAEEFVEIGDEIYFVQKAPEQAKEMYIQAAQLDPSNIKANYMAGKTISETINKGEATPYFQQVYQLDADYKFDLLYSIARSYQYGLQFEEAIEHYNRYLERLEQDKDYRGEDKIPENQVKRRIYECQNGQEFIANARNFIIKNIGSSINSNSLDYAPVINADETMMIFTSRRKQNNLNENVYDDNFAYEDIFISYKENGKWGPAKNIDEPVNTLYFESNLALSADGKQLYLYRDENNGDIYVSDQRSDGSWSEPEPVSDNINSSYSENSVTISPDGQTIYFSSDRPGGFGGLDLYKCEKDRKGEWGKVTNLGETVNTPYDEDGVFMDFDGKTLYFSSRGRKGMGGYDIFKSVYKAEDDSWNDPVNLGYPINTPDDDIFFVSTKDGKRGYFATVRNDGVGYLDIYMVEIPDQTEELANKLDKKNQKQLAKEEGLANRNIGQVNQPKSSNTLQPVQLLLKVEDASNQQALDAQVSLKGNQKDETLASQKIADGIYRFDIQNNKTVEYVLAVEKPGYVYKSVKVSIPPMADKPQEFRKKVTLDPVTQVATDYRMVLDFVYFDFNSAHLKDESQDELSRLKSFLEENPGVRVEIAGHTDNIGSATYNKALSQKRAQAIVNYLAEQGIATERLTAQGYGETDPIASNDDEAEGRELNRRVEMRVLESRTIANQ